MPFDRSNSGHTFRVDGDVSFLPDGSIGGDGSSMLYAADSPDWNFTGDFTVELFGVVFANVTAQHGLIGQYLSTGNQRSWGLAYRGDQSPKKLQAILSFNGSAADVHEHNTDLSAATSYDITLERSGTTLRMYIDGTNVYSETVSGSALFNSSAVMALMRGPATVDLLNGTIRAWRITKGTARYATDASYTVPSLPLPTS